MDFDRKYFRLHVGGKGSAFALMVRVGPVDGLMTVWYVWKPSKYKYIPKPVPKPTDPERMTVQKAMDDFGLPKLTAMAVYSHWSDAKHMGTDYNWRKLCALLARARRDESLVRARDES